MYQRILVPVDGSPTSRLGLQEAIRLSKLTGGQLRLVHVVDNLSVSMAMDGFSGFSVELADSLRAAGVDILEAARASVAAAGVSVDTVLHDSFEGPVHELVVADSLAWDADLIVLGTHGRRGVGRMLLGSSAEYILRIATVPVLLVRAPELAKPHDKDTGAAKGGPVSSDTPPAPSAKG
jgi:nucleotide-binding universal stress UspA family protein